MSRCKNCVVGLLGACSLDYCLTERTILIEEAQRRAEARGHTLGEFDKTEGYPIWEARCTRCGLLAAINLDPTPEQPDLSGDALSVDCTAA